MDSTSLPQYFRVKVNPKSNRSCITSIMADGTIKISVKSAPENGKANQEVIKVLAEEYNFKTSQINLISGHTSSLKLFRIKE
jgi:uncharacterized protein (TIGR00251 family)